MAMAITHYGSSAATYGDMCIVNIDGMKIMIDGGKTTDDAKLLEAEIRTYGTFNRFILSHWHDDHYGYLCNLARRNLPQALIYGFGNVPQTIALKPHDVFISDGRTYRYPVGNILFEVHPSNLADDCDENSNSMVTVIKNNVRGVFYSFADANLYSISAGSYDGVIDQIRACPNPIIKLPHHGSKGNCNALFERLGPQVGQYIISGFGAEGVLSTIDTVMRMGNSRLFWVGRANGFDPANGEFFETYKRKYRGRLFYTHKLSFIEAKSQLSKGLNVSIPTGEVLLI